MARATGTQKEMFQAIMDRLDYIEARQERIFRKLNILMEAEWFHLRRAKRHLVAEQGAKNPVGGGWYSRVERPQYAEEIINHIKCDQENGDVVKPLKTSR